MLGKDAVKGEVAGNVPAVDTRNGLAAPAKPEACGRKPTPTVEGADVLEPLHVLPSPFNPANCGVVLTPNSFNPAFASMGPGAVEMMCGRVSEVFRPLTPALDWPTVFVSPDLNDSVPTSGRPDNSVGSGMVGKDDKRDFPKSDLGWNLLTPKKSVDEDG